MGPNAKPNRILRALAAAAFMGLLCAPLVIRPEPASATAYVPVSGAGSTWSENALNQWITDVQQYGMRINYAGIGSTAGRAEFLNGTVDFAASDIPFQTTPDDGSAPEQPKLGTYAYMPVTAGGTTFMYNLIINGQRVTNMRLSGTNIAKIFTNQIRNWDDPALAADNPALKLPNRSIVPVVRSDGSGSTAQFTAWMIAVYPSIWNAYCQGAGRAPACGQTSFYPTESNSSMVAQSGDLGVAGYVAQNFCDGCIGYVNYSYALNSGFPVAKVLNPSGYYTEPTPSNVAVSLLKAKVDTQDSNNPALYLTQDLHGVYTDPDPRTYVLSSYSYMILPTAVQGQFTQAKGTTLAAFSYYAMCQGQQQSASLGYSPMPINLVQAAFDQIKKIPGAVVENINVQSCNNPTFSPSGVNLLAQSAPYPPACDHIGPTQCTTGTGGATKTPTANSAGTGKGTGSAGSGGSSSQSGAGGTNSSGASGSGASASNGSGSSGAAPGSSSSSCDPTTGACGASGAGSNGASDLLATPTTIGSIGGWGTAQLLMIGGVILLLILIAPGVVVRLLEKRSP